MPPSYCIYVFIKRLRIYKHFSVSFTFNKTLTHFRFHFNAFFEFLHKKTAHPERAFQERAFVAVAVLKEPIFWFRQKVQVVFLTAIGREEDENLQQFYEATTDLILRPADVQNLIRHPDYDRLIQLLRRAEE